MLPHEVKIFNSMKLSTLLKEQENKQLPKANDFRDMYKSLDINIDKLGCIMLDVDGSAIPEIPEEYKENLYTTKNKDRFWIKGFVAGETPHVTVLYGLMESGQKNKKYVDQVLDGWSVDEIEVESIGHFDSPYDDDPYYCIIAHLEVSDKLREGRTRLELLPHINTFPDFKAHVTIAYVDKKEDVRDGVIKFYKEKLEGKSLKVTELNYGK
jgi:2'-5' RNA ligase